MCDDRIIGCIKNIIVVINVILVVIIFFIKINNEKFNHLNPRFLLVH